jgi:gamma-glutamyl hydrolase
MGGARVVPLPYNTEFNLTRTLMTQLNGLLFTGGDNLLAYNPMIRANRTRTEIGQTICDMLDVAVELNRNGTYFPVWATCLGFEAMNLCTSITSLTFSVFADEPPIPHKLKFTDSAKESRLFTKLGRARGEFVLD